MRGLWLSWIGTWSPSTLHSKAVADPTLKEARLPNANDPTVHVRRDERPQGVIAYLTIDDGRGLNAINSALMDELVEAMGELASDDDLRAVVLSGAGAKAFIAGVDINEMAAIEKPRTGHGFHHPPAPSCDAIRDVPVPVIARIQGYAFGAGLELAAACDVRIASDAALFGMPEVKLGIPSVIEAALLPTLVGWGRAREMMYLGENFTADEALQWGLVEHVVPSSALDAAIEAWIAKLLTSAPRAVRLQKRLIRRWEDLPLAAAVQAGVEAFAAAYETDEPGAAMGKFLAAREARKSGG